MPETPDHTNQQTDKQLFRLISEGDESAFRTIFHSYRRDLYPVILSLVKVEADAKEILQETFLKLWLKRDTLPTIENPGGWLYTVASTEALMHLRKESRYTRRLQKFAASTAASTGTSNSATTSAIGASAASDLTDIHTAFDSKEVKALIAEAVEKLPLRLREIFKMSRLEGYSRKEIAEILGISENTIRNQLTDAVEFIQDYITKNKSLFLPALLIWIMIK